jgi:hypothetical protein
VVWAQKQSAIRRLAPTHVVTYSAVRRGFGPSQQQQQHVLELRTGTAPSCRGRGGASGGQGVARPRDGPPTSPGAGPLRWSRLHLNCSSSTCRSGHTRVQRSSNSSSHRETRRVDGLAVAWGRIGGRLRGAGGPINRGRASSSDTCAHTTGERYGRWFLTRGIAHHSSLLLRAAQPRVTMYPPDPRADVVCAVQMLLDYRRTLRTDYASPEQREAALSACHQRGADRLLALCFKASRPCSAAHLRQPPLHLPPAPTIARPCPARPPVQNGGVYTKLGQHVGQLDHLLPEEYVHTMRAHLLDRCPLSAPEDVRRIITQVRGGPCRQFGLAASPLVFRLGCAHFAGVAFPLGPQGGPSRWGGWAGQQPALVKLAMRAAAGCSRGQRVGAAAVAGRDGLCPWRGALRVLSGSPRLLAPGRTWARRPSSCSPRSTPSRWPAPRSRRQGSPHCC